jgi:hypothetical protein
MKKALEQFQKSLPPGVVKQIPTQPGQQPMLPTPMPAPMPAPASSP